MVLPTSWVCREALTAFEPPKLRGDGLPRFRSPRNSGMASGMAASPSPS